MARQMKALLAKSGDPGLKPGTHMVERENRFACSFLTFIHALWHVCSSRMHAHSKPRNKLISKYMFKKLNQRPPRMSSAPWLAYLYCKASLSAVALDSYFPTNMLILSALLLHSSRVMVRRSFWDLRCSMRLQRKRHWFPAAGL